MNRNLKDKCKNGYIYHRWETNTCTTGKNHKNTQYQCKRNPSCLEARYQFNDERLKKFIDNEYQEIDKERNHRYMLEDLNLV